MYLEFKDYFKSEKYYKQCIEIIKENEDKGENDNKEEEDKGKK